MNIITSNFFLAVSRVKLVDEPNIAFSLVNEGKINSWIPDYIIKPFKKKKKKGNIRVYANKISALFYFCHTKCVLFPC